MDDYSKLYDKNYFQNYCGRPYERDEVWMQNFGSIAENIVKKINPHTVLDAGCAKGFLVESLRNREVEAFGIDISEYAIQQVYEPIKPYCWVASITEPFPQKYDLIVTIEVLEHLPKPESEKAIHNLCLHTNDIIFSSTPFDYKEVTHFNVQPIEYWAELFAIEGFYRDVDFDGSFITPWTIRFVRKQTPKNRLVHDYERKFWLLWKENTDLRTLTLELRNQLESREAAEKQIPELIESIHNLQKQLTEKEHSLQTAQTLLTEREQTLKVTQNLLNKIQAELDLNKQALTKTNERLAEAIHNRQLIQNQLTEVLNSRSWRFMKFFQNIRLKLFPPQK